MSLRFGSGWLEIYFLICSCTFICSGSQLRARDCTTFNPFEPLPFSVTPDTRSKCTPSRVHIPDVLSATLPLADYGRVARYTPTIQKRFPQACFWPQIVL